MHGHMCVYVHKYAYYRHTYKTEYLGMYITGIHESVFECTYIHMTIYAYMHVCRKTVQNSSSGTT